MALFDNLSELDRMVSELNRMVLEVQSEINQLKKERLKKEKELVALQSGEVDAIDLNGRNVWFGVDLSQCDSKSNK